ncbi:hypothetical protein L4G92_00960 [Neisseria sp. ZJ106]|uniref:Uncharacterized protein n=1 Tax=Neisseria lisongii TaxID=2912188 RepID=A0ABY7RJM1_9NEIS|nr:hypothetical protein [Neisseria lisongii]MCF7520625.1 hypothetical protein [Neisseria lisongii]WCL71441.1 hypothetical protein PJU73_08965 [Neisseria lisongii]
MNVPMNKVAVPEKVERVLEIVLKGFGILTILSVFFGGVVVLNYLKSIYQAELFPDVISQVNGFVSIAALFVFYAFLIIIFPFSLFLVTIHNTDQRIYLFNYKENIKNIADFGILERIVTLSKLKEINGLIDKLENMKKGDEENLEKNHKNIQEEIKNSQKKLERWKNFENGKKLLKETGNAKDLKELDDFFGWLKKIKNTLDSELKEDKIFKGFLRKQDFFILLQGLLCAVLLYLVYTRFSYYCVLGLVLWFCIRCFIHYKFKWGSFFTSISVFLLCLFFCICLIFKDLYTSEILYPIRFIEKPQDSSWYLLTIDKENNPLHPEDFVEMKKEFKPGIKEFKLDICEKDDYLLNYRLAARKNALYGYMAWSLGDTKVFCPESAMNLQNKYEAKKCLVIKKDMIQPLNPQYISGAVLK